MRLSKSDLERIPTLLENECGNVAAVARSLGVSRSAIVYHLDKHPEWKQIRREAMESALDAAEQNLFKAAEEGNLTAIIFVLKTLGKERGYVERQQRTIDVNVAELEATLKTMNRDERERLRQRLRRGEPMERILGESRFTTSIRSGDR